MNLVRKIWILFVACLGCVCVLCKHGRQIVDDIGCLLKSSLKFLSCFDIVEIRCFPNINPALSVSVLNRSFVLIIIQWSWMVNYPKVKPHQMRFGLSIFGKAYTSTYKFTYSVSMVKFHPIHLEIHSLFDSDPKTNPFEMKLSSFPLNGKQTNLFWLPNMKNHPDVTINFKVPRRIIRFKG